MSENAQKSLAERVKHLTAMMIHKMNVEAEKHPEWSMLGLKLERGDDTKVTYKTDHTITAIKLKQNFGYFQIPAELESLGPYLEPGTVEKTHPYAIHIPITPKIESDLERMETHWQKFDQPSTSIETRAASLDYPRALLETQVENFKTGNHQKFIHNDRGGIEGGLARK